jgi:hypothetical protein
MYEEACKLMAKQSVALEVLSYHACAPQEETEKLQVFRNHLALFVTFLKWFFGAGC